MTTELPARPAYIPPRNVAYGRPPSTLDIGDAFSAYANPDPQVNRVVTLIAPPLYFSKNSYSTPLTMPLGLAYLAAVLEKAHYSSRFAQIWSSSKNCGKVASSLCLAIRHEAAGLPIRLQWGVVCGVPMVESESDDRAPDPGYGTCR